MRSVFSLTVQDSICLSVLPSFQSVQSHFQAPYMQNHSSIWNLHPRHVTGGRLPSQLHLTDTSQRNITGSAAVKGRCVSSQTGLPKNSQRLKYKTHTRQLGKDLFYLEKVDFSPCWWHNCPSKLQNGSCITWCSPQWTRVIKLVKLLAQLESIWEETGAVQGAEVNFFLFIFVFFLWLI